MIAAAPDLVCVMTESGHHAAHAGLLNAGLNVLVEKPVALRPEDALAMRDAAAANGVICAVVKQNRYNPAMRFLRSAVDDGRMGRLVTAGVRVHWSRDQSYYDDPWHGRWAMDGGILTQQAIHHLDGLQWLAGPVEASVPPARQSSIGSRRRIRRSPSCASNLAPWAQSRRPPRRAPVTSKPHCIWLASALWPRLVVRRST